MLKETKKKILWAKKLNMVIILKLKVFRSVFSHAFDLEGKVIESSIVLRKARENQEEFELNLSETTTGKWEYKSEEQKSTTKNLGILYKAWEKVIELFRDYTRTVSKAKYKAEHGKGLKELYQRRTKKFS